MKQYCRYCGYCGHCFEGDVYFCTVHDKVLSESALKSANNCFAYGDCGIDVITHKKHIERKIKPKLDDGSEQIRMDEVSEQ